MLSKPNSKKRKDSEEEETYERMYPKIGRDFVHIEDLKRLIDELNRILIAISVASGTQPMVINFNQVNNTMAIQKGLIYKDVIETGKDGSKIFKDIVSIDKDDEA